MVNMISYKKFIRHFAPVLLAVILSEPTGILCQAGSSRKIETFKPLPADLKQVWVDQTNSSFKIHPQTFAWISDIEHVYWEQSKTSYLADAQVPYYLCGATVPGHTSFELFPYHYYDQKEAELLGGEINYKLIAKNISNEDVVLEIEGMGTTRDWDHHKAWQGALGGEGKKVVVLKPGQSITIWQEKSLKGDLPWSAIVFGKASGDLWFCDYVYLCEDDPGIENAKAIPDLSLSPIDWPSFTRGIATWHRADIHLFPNLRTPSGRIDLSNIQSGIYSFAVSDSPGGPASAPADYTAVRASFKTDEYPVLDPVSQISHRFFGGNYPVMYNVSVPLANTTDKKIKVSFYICSNDKFGVDSLIGVWMDGQLSWARAPMILKNQHWELFVKEVLPGQIMDIEFVMVPLGSRWGSMIGSFAVHK